MSLKVGVLLLLVSFGVFQAESKAVDVKSRGKNMNVNAISLSANKKCPKYQHMGKDGKCACDLDLQRWGDSCQTCHGNTLYENTKDRHGYYEKVGSCGVKRKCEAPGVFCSEMCLCMVDMHVEQVEVMGNVAWEDARKECKDNGRELLMMGMLKFNGICGAILHQTSVSGVTWLDLRCTNGKNCAWGNGKPFDIAEYSPTCTEIAETSGDCGALYWDGPTKKLAFGFYDCSQKKPAACEKM